MVDPSDKNIAWINPKWFSKHTAIANLNIDTSFVDIGALGVKILIFKGQICLHLQTRALALWPKQILEALRIKSTKSEGGTTDGFYKIQFMWDLSSRELRNQLHSTQYRQFILHILFTDESTPLSINTLLKSSNHSLKRILHQISRESWQEGLEIFWGPKDISSLVDDPPGKSASKIRDDQPDLERSDNKFLSRNGSTMSKVCWCSREYFHRWIVSVC